MTKRKFFSNRLVALILAIMIAVPTVFANTFADTIVVSQATIDVGTITTTVYEAAEYESLQSQLLEDYPTITAELAETFEDTTLDVVEWVSENYNSSSTGAYSFTPVFTDKYDFAEGEPTITVVLEANTISEVLTDLSDIDADSLEDAKEMLPNEIEVVINVLNNSDTVETDEDETAESEAIIETESEVETASEIDEEETISTEELSETESESETEPAEEETLVEDDAIVENETTATEETTEYFVTISLTVKNWDCERISSNDEIISYLFTPDFGDNFENAYVWACDEPAITAYVQNNEKNNDDGVAVISDSNASVVSNNDGVAVISDSNTSVINSDDGVAAISDVEDGSGYVSEISSLSVTLVSGATLNDNGDYVWAATSSASGHKYKFRVAFSTSGTGTLSANEFIIKIPTSILVDKNGNSADEISMSYPSSDELEDMTETELEETDGFAYYIKDGYIVVYNFKEISATTEGYFEVSYATSKTTFNYYDYGSDGTFSTAFNASISVSGLEDTSDDIYVYMDTGVEISSTSKGYPTLYTSWNSSWGTEPSDLDSCYYLVWEITTKINTGLTQYYDFTLTDNTITYTATYSDGTTASGSLGDGAVSIVAYKMQGGSYTVVGAEDYESLSVTMSGLSGTTRYDYVVVALSSDIFSSATSFTVKNTETATVTPADGVDSSTSAMASKTFSYTVPTWSEPSGSFNIWKYGNENYSSSFGKYITYDLNLLQDDGEELEDIKYLIKTAGYAYPWTLRDDWAETEGYYTTTSDGSIIPNYNAYGYNDVTYVISDDTIYPLNSDGIDLSGNAISTSTTYSESNYETVEPLESEDYDFSYITYSIVLKDAERDENGDPTVDSSYEYNVGSVLAEDDEFILYVKVDGEWLTAGVYNLYSKTWTANSDGGNYVSSISSSSIYFNEGVDGYKIELTNNYYYTGITAYVYITLYPTDNVLEWVGTGDDVKDVVLMRNVVSMDVYYADEYIENGEDAETIVSISKVIGDRLRRSEKDSYITKKAVSSSSSTTSKTYTINWRAVAYETVTTGDNDTDYLQQSSGTFYDLLPYGSTYVSDSVSIKTEDGYLSENEYTVELTDNYNNSGRTLLVVFITTSADYYYVYFSTVYSWETLIDVGYDILNPIAYETGNDSITNGYADNAGGLSSENDNNVYMTDLDSTTDDAKFLYAEASYTVDTEFSASSGLTKKVKAESDTSYSYDTTVSISETYSYRIRYQNSYSVSSKNIIFYDSLENYNNASDWYGTLTAIDTTQIESLGISPVIYISTIESLDLSEQTDLTDTSIWTVVSNDTDLSTAKAVAIDMTYDENGNVFELEAGASVVVVLYMTAPATDASDTSSDYPETYNNIYMSSTLTSVSSNTETDNYIYHNYTTAVLAVTGNLSLLKVNEEDTDEVIFGITFVLSGTSDYGTEVYEEKTTNSNGIITWSDIEKGTYTLQEIGTYDDWLADHEERIVVIDENGVVTVDGEEITDYYVFENAERIHADITIYKRNSSTGSVVSGATFRLYGTSDYGTTVNTYSTTSVVGTLTFENIEKGTYTLVEFEAADGYILDGAEFTVKVDAYGNVSISKANSEGYAYVSSTASGIFYIYNQPTVDLTILKRSSYDNQAVEGVEFTLKGTSNLGNYYESVLETGENGSITFEGLEPGTYTLQETSIENAQKTVASDDTIRIVVVSEDGTITVDGEELNKYGNYVIYNTEIATGTVSVIKYWDTDDTSVLYDENGDIVLFPTIYLATVAEDDDEEEGTTEAETETAESEGETTTDESEE